MPEAAESSTAAPPATVLAFLIADVRGYTSFTNQHGIPAAARLADRFAVVCKAVVSQREGEVIELRGDEALSVFSSPRSALLAAVELQGRFQEEMGADPSLPLRVGMGIDVGEAVPIQGGYRGRALNLAARLCSLAGPAEVFASEEVVRQAQRIEGLAYVERGRVQLKGFDEPIRVIHILRHEALPENFPPLVSLVARPSNLPLQATPFIGREREVGQIAQLLLQEDIRLLTLTGPGGTGKTRLALQVGGAVLDRFERGVFFVSLASLSDPGLIASIIASTLKVKEGPEHGILATLIDHLRDKQMLLVLDNFEHLLEGAPVISELLAACPNLTILVTSRAVLHLSAEHDYAVPPLTVPDPTHLPGLEVLTQYEAVVLFVERARAVKPDFAVTNENAPAVAEICYRLDGLPLAIELAAARTRYLPPPALLARLSSRLKLLTGGARDAPGRQQTLRATIDWSYSLLSEGEQQLFARLGVFHGGCTLEAAEAVCNPAEGPGLDILDGMGSLVAKSLLRQEGDEEPRFLLLETIREYATERLEASGEAEQAREQHAQYYLTLAEEVELQGAHKLDWLNRLGTDHDNLRAALGWFLKRGEVEQEMRLATALQPLWGARCFFREGRQWLEAGLSQGEQVSRPVRMEALRAAGTLAMLQSDQARTITLMNELLPLAREEGDPIPTMIAVQRGDHRQAAVYLEEYHSIARAQGSQFDLAHSLLALGAARSEAGRYAEVATLLEEALTLFRAMGDEYWEMIAVGTLAYALLLAANQERARALLLEYLALAQRFEDTANIAASLEGLAILASEAGRAERAARLFAAAESLRRAIGSRLMSLRNQAMMDQAVSSAREQLGDRAWLAAWEEGQAMTIEQAVALAVETEAGPDAATG